MRFRRLLAFGLACLLAGCASLFRPSALPPPQSLGRIAVVAIDSTPEVTLEGFSGGRLAGFSQGAGDTFTACLQFFGQGACVNSACGAYVLVLLGTCSTLGVVGGLIGSLSTDGDASRRAAAQGIDGVLLAAPAQNRLRDSLIESVRQHGVTLSAVEAAAVVGDYRALAAADISTVIEVELLRVGTAGPGSGAPSRLYMEARARLVRVSDNAELASRRFTEYGPTYSAWEWRANGGERLIDGFQSTYDRLAGQIGNAFLRPVQ